MPKLTNDIIKQRVSESNTKINRIADKLKVYYNERTILSNTLTSGKLYSKSTLEKLNRVEKLIDEGSSKQISTYFKRVVGKSSIYKENKTNLSQGVTKTILTTSDIFRLISKQYSSDTEYWKDYWNEKDTEARAQGYESYKQKSISDEEDRLMSIFEPVIIKK